MFYGSHLPLTQSLLNMTLKWLIMAFQEYWLVLQGFVDISCITQHRSFLAATLNLSLGRMHLIPLNCCYVLLPLGVAAFPCAYFCCFVYCFACVQVSPVSRGRSSIRLKARRAVQKGLTLLRAATLSGPSSLSYFCRRNSPLFYLAFFVNKIP